MAESNVPRMCWNRVHTVHAERLQCDAPSRRRSMKRTMFASALCAGICFAPVARAQEMESALVRQLYNGGWPGRAVEQGAPLPARDRGLHDDPSGAECDRHAGWLGGEVREGLQRSAGLEGSYERQDAGADAEL